MKVFFNASVILAGIKNPKGGSGKLLNWAKEKAIEGIASEIILDECLRKSEKIGKTPNEVGSTIQNTLSLLPPPPKHNVEKWNNIVLDHGDCHVLASTKESKSSYLVTLDRKHLLSLSNKIKSFKILSPKELIEQMKRK